MRFDTRIDIDAAPDIVWATVSGVAHWPQFIPTVDSVTLQDDGTFGAGSSARVKQPGMPAMTWHVTAWEDGKSFTWQARSPGVLTTATHVLTPRADGSATVTLGIEQTGPLARLIAFLTGARTRRYVTIEAAGLKAESERAAGTTRTTAGL